MFLLQMNSMLQLLMLFQLYLKSIFFKKSKTFSFLCLRKKSVKVFSRKNRKTKKRTTNIGKKKENEKPFRKQIKKRRKYWKNKST